MYTMNERSRLPIGGFVHIEKTAGTTARAYFEEALGRGAVYAFSPAARKAVPSSSLLDPATDLLLDQLRLSFDHPVIGSQLVRFWPAVLAISKLLIQTRYPQLEVPDHAKLFMGHFTVEMMQNIIGDRRIISAVSIRDPLDRMISLYDHWKRNRGFEDWRINVAYRADMSFEEFAFLDVFKNCQTMALSGMHIDDFDVVGITDFTELFILKFLERLSDEGLTLPNWQERICHVRNRNVSHRKTVIKSNLKEEFLNAFREFHNADYALYERAKSLALLK